MKKSSVAYIYSQEYGKATRLLPVHSNREVMTYSLLCSTGIIKHLNVVEPLLASFDDLAAFHAQDYLQALCNKSSELLHIQEEYGLADDCPPFPNVFRYCQAIAGGSITAASILLEKKSNVAIHWGGGRHHATTASASGFCYVNDVVLAVQALLPVFPKVLVIDIDIHHGDGVESAFYYSPNVFTISFHKLAPGYFPGTGEAKCVGQQQGRYTNLNLPLLDGLSDSNLKFVWNSVIPEILKAFAPSAIVSVIGLDTIGQDPLGTFNVTSSGISDCLETLVNYSAPLLVLGGGGYDVPNATRCFTALTAQLVHLTSDDNIRPVLPKNIPDCDPFFPCYGPDFLLQHKSVVHRPSLNTLEFLQATVDRALRHIKKYQDRKEDSK